LVTRGFQVEVIDPAFNEEFSDATLDRGIGGMARSQWALSPNASFAGAEMLRLWPGPDFLFDVVLLFDQHTKQDTAKPRDKAYVDRMLGVLARTLRDLGARKLSPTSINIRLHGLAVDVDPMTDSRAIYIRDALTAGGVETKVIALLFTSWPDATDDARSIVTFAQIGHAVPAEHGFRFFPSFYRHLFDTMKRTPIVDPGDAQRTKATTFDNLVPSQGLGFARKAPAVSFAMPRRAMSLEASRKILDQVLDDLGYTAADIARFSLKIVKYMTSSSARRAREYEDLSWGDFLESWRYSEISREHIEYGPQMSAALRGSKSDARTQGNITIQLLMDQLKPDSEADYTLSGPTSSYWLNHWHNFLARQGVGFRRGRLSDFKVDGDRVVPVLEDKRFEPSGTHYVLALPLQAMAPLAVKLRAAAARLPAAAIAEGELDDLERIAAFAGDPGTLATALPDGPLQHLSGIQYYFDHELRFWRGHTQYLDSAWGLTSIAQAQFWARPRNSSDEYRAILSVDIGIFDRPYQPKDAKRTPVTAWECTSVDIAWLAWEQIHDHHITAFKALYGSAAEIPAPIAYSLDGTLVFMTDGQLDRDGTLAANGSPFLVNKTGAYPTRPGKVNRSGSSKTESLYDVILGHYVLAGTFMQTFTRLTSMEGANESGRHAVNALLQALRVPGDRCDIWDPEDHELDDLRWLRDLDERLLGRGLPHFIDILGWDELPTQLEHLRHVLVRLERNHDT
jgi:hypothetical protein